MAKMARVKCLVFFAGILCNSAFSSEITSALKDVQHCFHKDPAPCLVDHTIDQLLEVTNLTDVLSKNNESRSSTLNIEERLFEKLIEAFGISPSASNFNNLDGIQTGRADPVLRTFNKAWKYIIPLLIGVKLKLATFVPFVLTILTLIAKSAFVSGNMALLLTGLNIALKYWYPKIGSEHHIAYPNYQQHSQYQHSDDYAQHQNMFQGHHHQNLFQGHQNQNLFQGHQHQNLYQNQHQDQFLNNFDNAYKNQKVSDIEFGTTLSK